MISCTKSRDNVDMFYFKGKRISVKKALQLQKKKGLVISECQSVYDRSTRPIREVMKKVDECESRFLNTKQKYDELYDKLTDASDSIEVLNKICLSREFKQKVEDSFKQATDELNKEINVHKIKLTELNKEKEQLNKRIDENIININDLTDLVERSKDELRILKEMNAEEKELKASIKSQLDDLTKTCSDRPALQQSIIMLTKGLNEQRALFQDKEALLQAQIIDYDTEVKRTLEQLKVSEEKYNKTLLALEDNQILLQNLRTDIEKLQRDNSSMSNEISELQKEVITGKEAARILEELKVELKNNNERETELLNKLKEEKDELLQKDLELQRVKELIEDWMGKFKKLEDECSDRPTLMKKISELEEMLTSGSLNLKTKEENELVLTKQVNDIQKQLENTNKTLKELEDVCSDRPQLLLKVDKLQSFVDESTELLKKRDNELTSVKTVLSNIEDKYEEEVKQKKKIQEEKKKLSEELAQLYDQSTAQLKKSNDSKLEIQQKVINLQKENKEINKTFEESLAKLNEEQKKRNKTEDDLTKSIKQIEELDLTVSTLTEKLDNRDKDIQKELKENDLLKTVIQEQKDKLETYVNQNKEKDIRIEELMREVEALKELNVTSANKEVYDFEKLNIELQKKDEIVAQHEKDMKKFKSIVDINLKTIETERAKSKRLQQELADEKVTSEKLLELSKERQKGCKNIGEKLTEAEDKLKKLKDCCGERSKLLLKIEELKGDIESIKNAAKTEGPSRLTMEMRIKHLRRKY